MTRALLTAAIAIVVSSPAAAATVSATQDGSSYQDSHVRYVPPTLAVHFTAAPGEANRVRVAAGSASTTITDPGATLTPGTNCAPVDTHTVVCAVEMLPPGLVVADLGDEDDTLTTEGLEIEASGGPGTDTLTGGPGNDTLSGDGGRDTLDGRGGLDRVLYLDDGPIVVDLADAKPDGPPDEPDELRSIERVFGGPGDDVLRGDAGPNTLRGGGGADTLAGRGGDDLLYGGQGRDQIDGGAGADEIGGGSAADVLLGGAGDDSISGLRDDASAFYPSKQPPVGFPDTVGGGPGDDTLAVVGADSVITGGAGDDVLRAPEEVRAAHCGIGRDAISAWDEFRRVPRGCERIGLRFGGGSLVARVVRVGAHRLLVPIVRIQYRPSTMRVTVEVAGRTVAMAAYVTDTRRRLLVRGHLPAGTTSVVVRNGGERSVPAVRLPVVRR